MIFIFYKCKDRKIFLKMISTIDFYSATAINNNNYKQQIVISKHYCLFS